MTFAVTATRTRYFAGVAQRSTQLPSFSIEATSKNEAIGKAFDLLDGISATSNVDIDVREI